MFSTKRAITVLGALASGMAIAGTALATAPGAPVGWTRTSTSPARSATPTGAPTPRLPGADVVTIRRIWRPTVVQTVDLAPSGPSPGDQTIIGGPLYDKTNTTRLGFLSGHCTTTNPSFRSLADCELTAVPTAHGPSLAAGNQITLQGWNDDTPLPFKQAITGGTGIYATARGQVIATPGTPFRVVFQLAH